MKVSRVLKVVACASGAVCLMLLHGCGGGSANVITVTVTSSAGTTLVIGTSTTVTATVSGATNLGITWEPLQYTTTTVTNGKPTTSTPTAAPSDGSFGTLTNETNTSPATATYTAPTKLPDQTKFPGLQIIITAQSQQDTKKTGSLNITLDSGIGQSLSPVTASVPTNEPQPFTAVLTNDTTNQGVVWLLTQQTPNVTNPATPYPQLATCSPTCGSIQSTGLYTATYTAPSAVPTACTPAPASGTSCTAPNVTIVATAKADSTRVVIGTITIVQGGPITFSAITPTIAPQGAAFWDVYLTAPNISSASKIILTDQNGGTKTFASTDQTNQIKVLFPIPTTATPNPSSTGARLRLLQSDLSAATSYTFSVTDPGEPVTNTPNLTLTLQPVRTTVVSSSPDSVVQDPFLQNNFGVTINGGYFGNGGNLANVSFQGNTLAQTPSTTSSSQRYNALLPSTDLNGLRPGLYPLSVVRTTPPLATTNNPAVSSLSIFPDYRSATPTVVGSVAAATNPSSVDIDPVLGVIVVAETGSNSVEFFTIGSGSLTSAGKVAVGNLPTGVSVNRSSHSVAVVNYGSKSVSILPIPGAPNPVPAATVDLSGVLQGVASPAPVPYSIGVDPDTNLALVAFSCGSISCAANLGFVVNLNQGAPFGCLQSGATPPCVYSQVTLNTGSAPQIAMASHGHLAFVTPGAATLGGGRGSISGIDVTQPSTSVGISTLTDTAGTVTVTTSADLTGLVPGEPTTVLISGVPAPGQPGNSSSVNFNGIFSIAITGKNTFTYVLNLNATGAASAKGGSVFYGSPNLSFTGVSSGGQGIAINPITHTAAIANPNATQSQQINLLNQLDLAVTSISLSASCTFYNTTGFTTPCPSGGADQGNADVAWQPYTNSVVSYNPNLNQVSVSDPVTQTRRAFACAATPCSPSSVPPGKITLAGGAGAGQVTLSNNLTLFGGIAVDPDTNQAFVVQSGNNAIQIVNLNGAIANKAINVTEVVVPSASRTPGSIGGVPNAFLPQGTLTSITDLPSVKILGSGFTSGTPTVQLDGTPISTPAPVSDREVDVTIPHSFLSMPHRYALTVTNGTVTSNATDFIVVQSVDLTKVCASPNPTGVAIADQLLNGSFSPFAVVTNTGCNSISMVDINPAHVGTTFGTITNPFSTTLPATVAVGASPKGIAISQALGYAVVTNNGDGTASVVKLSTMTQAVPAVATGTGPTGVAINDATGAALVTNFSANTVSVINLGLLTGSSPATSLTASSIGGIQQPIAVAIDPDGGTNHNGLAVVTGFQTTNTGGSSGALYPVDIGLASPTLSSTVTVSSVTSTPSGIVFNPAVNTGSSVPGLFYVNSSGGDTILSYNDNTGSQSSATVGINPTALAINPQTGAILTTNFAGKSVSVVDTLSNPFTTRATYGLPGSVQFGVAIDQFTNLAVIVDQANNRVLLFAMPN